MMSVEHTITLLHLPTTSTTASTVSSHSPFLTHSKNSLLSPFLPLFLLLAMWQFTLFLEELVKTLLFTDKTWIGLVMEGSLENSGEERERKL